MAEMPAITKADQTFEGDVPEVATHDKKGSVEIAFYRQTTGKSAGNTVMFRANWLSRVARNHAHADDWHPGSGFLGQREPPAAITPSREPRVSAAQGHVTVSGAVFSGSYDCPPEPCLVLQPHFGEPVRQRVQAAGGLGLVASRTCTRRPTPNPAPEVDIEDRALPASACNQAAPRDVSRGEP